MAAINLNNYVQITGEELILFLLNSGGYDDYQEIRHDLDDNLFDWVEIYLSAHNIDYGDLSWEEGVSDLSSEIEDYLYDKLHKDDLND